MRLVRIDCNKGKSNDGAFVHTVYDCGKVNGKRTINKLASIRFDGVLSEPEWLAEFAKNPEEYLRGLTHDSNSSQCADNNSHSDSSGI